VSTASTADLAARITRQMGELPTSLEVVCRLMLMLRNPTQENEAVVAALYSDRQLCGQLVRRLEAADEQNVDEKGHVIRIKRSEAEELQMLAGAVLSMGYTAILRLVSALSVGKLLAAEHKGYGIQRRELWVHSVVVGLIAQRLCELLAETGRGSIDPSLAFIGGLMHDTGKVALSSELQGRLPDVNKAAFAPGANWVAIETDYCGLDHAEIGAHLMQLWKLPQEIADAVAYHHRPRGDQKIAAIVHLADYASRFVVNPGGWSGYAILVDPSALAICRLRLEDLQRVGLHVGQDRKAIDNYVSM
jgi:putative nucleotidyltransferase with HDIG domain